MNEIKEIINNAGSIQIAGHIRPDGDCIGSCLAMYYFVKELSADANVSIYLELVPQRFAFLNEEHIITDELPFQNPDLFICVDCSNSDRLGKAEEVFFHAKTTMCFDHHISNDSFAMHNFINPKASSACEVIYEYIEKIIGLERICFEMARALYIGIITDSGIFCYDQTSKRTMEIAGNLMDKGIPFGKLQEQCFLSRSIGQMKVLGQAMVNAQFYLEHQVIATIITREMLHQNQAKTEDVEGVVEELRQTKGVEVSMMMHEIADDEYKVSLRSCDYVDVSSIAVYFGGGGHKKAAGFQVKGTEQECLTRILEQIQLRI